MPKAHARVRPEQVLEWGGIRTKLKTRYGEDLLTNNVSELNLRRQVLERRNWLFVGSDDGALVNTVFVSLLASARLHDIEPLAYLRDLLCLLPLWPRQRLLELAPAYWKQTLEQPETQQKLAANVFRRVLLSPPS